MIARLADRAPASGKQKLILLIAVYALMIGIGVWDALHPTHLHQGPAISQISPDGKYEAYSYHIKDEWALGTLRHYYLLVVIDLDTGLCVSRHSLPSSTTGYEDSSGRSIVWNEGSTFVKFGNPTDRDWSVTVP